MQLEYSSAYDVVFTCRQHILILYMYIHTYKDEIVITLFIMMTHIPVKNMLMLDIRDYDDFMYITVFRHNDCLQVPDPSHCRPCL